MQDIPQNTLNETTKTEQSARIDLWEIDLTAFGGQRYYFSNEANEKGEPVTGQGRKYDVYPIQGTGFDLGGERNFRPPDAGSVEPVWHGYGTCGRYAEPRRSHGGKACCIRPFSRCGELY